MDTRTALAELTATTDELTHIRCLLIDARERAESARAALTLAIAQAEREIIDAAGGPKALGGNEADRERALTIALAEYPAVTVAQQHVEDAARALAELEADFEAARDRRRLIEWHLRLGLIDRSLLASRPALADALLSQAA